MTGNDVISAVQQYQNSNDLSVRIVVAPATQFETGKYAVTLTDTTAATYESAKAGGVPVTYTGTTSYDDSKHDSLSTIQAAGGVSGTQTYYSYVMKDKDSDTVMGILFVRKGQNGFTGGKID